MPWGRVIPYCGLPPSPGELISRWNLDPVLIVALAALWVSYALVAKRRGWTRQWAFHLGWVLTALLLVSPICPLSVSLFSARVGQHMLLTMVAAPLVAFGLPRVRGGGLGANPLVAAALFSVALGYWHAPAPYDRTFESIVVYWVMHLSLYGSGVWLWRALFGRDQRLAPVAGAIVLTSSAMAMVGAVLTFAAHPMFTPHLVTAYAWGLSPLQDQQLGGILMWIPAGLLMTVGVVAGMARLIVSAGEVRPVQAPA